MKQFIKNPISIWIKWIFETWRIRRKNFALDPDIRYMARAIRCTFGRCNRLYDGAVLTDTSLGDFTYVANASRLSQVQVGKFCCIGPEVLVGLGKHPSRHFVSSHPAFYSPLAQAQVTFSATERFNEFEQVQIGHDVWIGARAIIVDGIRIGNGAIVGAGAVVTKDVPAYAVVVGVPARIVRYRFNPEQIHILESINWWDKDENWLRENYMVMNDIDEFLSRVTKNNIS